MKKAEILKLSELSEDEQYEWLQDKCIVVCEQQKFQMMRWESLADCAFRLRDEYLATKDVRRFATLLEGLAFKLGTKPSLLRAFFADKAGPINWIQAVLEDRESESE